jgi:hypothetical protein
MGGFLAEYYKHGNALIIMFYNAFPVLLQLFAICHDLNITLFFFTVTPLNNTAVLKNSGHES